MTEAFGGVVIDHDRRVLLRKPTDEYDDYVWTFAKGGRKASESDEAAALREVCEETGAACEIIAPLGGALEGGTTQTHYFLMRVLSMGTFGWETEAIAWVTIDEVARRIGQTRNPRGRKRDLEVLRRVSRLLQNDSAEAITGL